LSTHRTSTLEAAPGVRGPALAAGICARHLGWLGVDADVEPGPGDAFTVVAGGGIECILSWAPPGGQGPGLVRGENVVQACCGLMEVHGRTHGGPRRLGLDVASVAGGALAGQAVLAALVAGDLGAPVGTAATSVLAGGLWFLCHHLTAATTDDDWDLPEEPGHGPPFRTADDQWVELEALSPESWRTFWASLGATPAELDRAWLQFAFRTNRGRCHLPPALHEAAARHTALQLLATADACPGVAARPVRGYDEVLADAAAAGPGGLARPPWRLAATGGPRAAATAATA
jgi:crotonobetainyl-CoA:carnitine CoA-transferase CaiB-like acyl-CoA transferase